MRILVTGAGGFVGRHLLRLLQDHPHHTVYALAREVEDLDLPPEQRHAVDLRDREAVAAAMARMQPQILVHLAGTTSVAQSWDDPETTFETNVLGTLHLSQAILPDSLVRWINAGSAEEYAARSSPLDESDPLRPASPYGTSKVAQEWLLHQMAQQKRFALWQFRAFNQTGPGQAPSFVVPSLARQVFRAKSDQIDTIQVGNLSPVRDFLDVRDSAQLYVEAVEGRIPPGTYNLCSGNGRSIQSILDDLLELAGVRAKTVVDPSRFRPVDAPYLVGSPHHLETALGRPVATVSWAKTLADLWQSLLESHLNES